MEIYGRITIYTRGEILKENRESLFRGIPDGISDYP